MILTQSPSLTRGRARRGSASRCSSGSSAGRSRAVTSLTRSRLSRSDHSEAVAAGIGRDQFADVEDAVGEKGVLVPPPPGGVQRVPAGTRIVLGEHAAHRRGPGPPLVRVLHDVVPPGFAPDEEARLGGQQRVVDLGQFGQGRLRLGDPQPQPRVRGSLGAEHALAVPDGEARVPGGAAVAEPAVDPRVRGPEHRDGLAPLVDVVELPAHQAGQDAAPPVGGHDRDPGHPGRRRQGARARPSGSSILRRWPPGWLRRTRPGCGPVRGDPASQPAAARSAGCRETRAHSSGGRRRTRSLRPA